MFSKRYMVVMRLGGCECEQSRASTKYPVGQIRLLQCWHQSKKANMCFFMFMSGKFQGTMNDSRKLTAEKSLSANWQSTCYYFQVSVFFSPLQFWKINLFLRQVMFLFWAGEAGIKIFLIHLQASQSSSRYLPTFHHCLPEAASHWKKKSAGIC